MWKWRAIFGSLSMRGGAWAIALVAGLGSGCLHRPVGLDRATVSRHIEQRMGSTLGPHVPPSQLVLPPGMDRGRPLTEDEVVLVALWNNPLFLETLVELQLTRADLVQADLLPNPDALYLFSAPDKAYRYAAEFPLEALWLRPIRVRNARSENARAAERLTQVALDLIRDTRQAYADVLLARERMKIAKKATEIRGGLADLAAARLKAGDASVQEASTAKIDGLQAEQDAARISYETPLAEERLRNLMGLSGVAIPLSINERATTQAKLNLNLDELTAEAMRSRPDYLAAEHAATAAAERLRLARCGWFRIFGIVDATAGLKTGHEFGPGARLTLPIFNWNQGGIARAQAEWEQLERRRVTVQNQIALDVRQAHFRFLQANSEREIVTQKVKPEVEANIERAKKAYKDGGASYVIVLENTRQLIDTENREAQLVADLRRAWADLERSVGRRLRELLPSPRIESQP